MKLASCEEPFTFGVSEEAQRNSRRRSAGPPRVAKMSEVEETLKRINSHKGVKGIVICDEAGTPIRTTLNQEETAMYATHLGSFGTKARSAVRDLDPQNDLTFLRIRTKKHEMMVAPEKDFLLIVVQDPNSE